MKFTGSIKSLRKIYIKYQLTINNIFTLYNIMERPPVKFYNIRKLSYISLLLCSLMYLSMFMVTNTISSQLPPSKDVQTTSISSISCSGDANCDTVLGAYTGIGTKADPYVISGQDITSYGIDITHTTRSFTIQGNNITSLSNAIQLVNVSGQVIVEDNYIYSTNYESLLAYNMTDSLIVRNNTFYNNVQDWSIFIGDNILSNIKPSNHVEIYNNSISYGAKGISVYQANSSVIYNNTIMAMTWDGITVGVNNDTYIHDNTLQFTGYGLRINNNNNTFAENNIINTLDGTQIDGIFEFQLMNDPSLYNRTYKNNIIHNLQGNGLNLYSFAKAENNTISNVGKNGILGMVNSSISGNFITSYASDSKFVDSSYGINTGGNCSIIENHIVEANSTAIITQSHSKVIGNIINNITGYGIESIDSIDVYVGSNIISNTTSDSISISAGDAEINGNQITSSLQNAIYIQYGDGSKVTGNKISKSGGSGIYLDGTVNAIVDANTVSESQLFGIYSYSSPTTTLTNNVLSDYIGLDGTHIATYTGYIVSGNTVNGLPFGYFEKYASNITGSYGQIFVVDCANIALVDISINNAKIAISVLFSQFITFDNLNLVDSQIYALYLHGLEEARIYNSLISSTNGTGIYSDYGIYLHDSKIIDSVGIGVVTGIGGEIIGNTISGNGGIGLRVDGRDVTISDNTFENNGGYAILMGYKSTSNFVHHNNFINNNPTGSSQSYDNGTGNIWYDQDTMEGNYWSDYSGSGTYDVNGQGSVVVDNYPFNSPILFPRVIPSSSTSSTAPTSTTPSESSSKDTNKGGFLPSPMTPGVVLLFSVFIATIRKKQYKS